MTRRTAIVFDAVGTVIYPHPSVKDVYCFFADRHGLNMDRQEIGDRIQIAWQQALDAASPIAEDTELKWLTSHCGERSFWLRFVQSVFPQSGPVHGLFEDLWEHFAQAEHWRLYADVIPAWESLIERGLTVHVASNFDARLHAIGAELFPRELVTNVWTSAEIGWRKPSRYFFDHVVWQLGGVAHPLVYVGDQWRLDVLPARSRGLGAVQIDRTSGQPSPTYVNDANPTDPDVRLGRLTDISRWLDRDQRTTP